MNADKPRFFNFPLILLSGTYADPEAGLGRILNYGIHEYSKHCRRDFEDSFSKAVYTYQTKPGMLSPDVSSILDRDDIKDFAENAGCDCGGIPEQVKEELSDMDFEFSETEQEAVISWLALRDAAHYFNRTITNFPAFTRTNESIKKEVTNHQYAHGALVCVGVPSELVYETIDQAGNIDTLRLFRMVCAARSIIGKKTTAGTTKDFIRARMIGAKTPAIAATLLKGHKELASEYKLMKSRKRFDRILMEGAIRKFYGKLGAGRRIHLSLEIKEPAQLKATIKTKMALRKAYAQSEQAARDTKGHNEGSNRGSIGGSLNKTLNKDSIKKTCKDKVHPGCTDNSSLPF